MLYSRIAALFKPLFPVKPAAADLAPSRAASAPRFALPSLPGISASLTIQALRQLYPSQWIVAVTSTPHEMDNLRQDLDTLARLPNLGTADTGSASPDDGQIILLPHPEPGLPKDIELEGARMDAANKLARCTESDRPAGIILATSSALLEPLPDPRALADAGLHIKTGTGNLGFQTLCARLIEGGYSRESEVVAKGQLAIRGGLLDIWPPDTSLPLRIDFFGDEVDKIRVFDPASQRSTAIVQEAWLPPCQLDKSHTTPTIKRLPSGIFLWLEHDRIVNETLADGASTPTLEAWSELRRQIGQKQPMLELFSGDPAPARTPALPVDIAAPPSLSLLDDQHPDLAAARQRLIGELGERDGWETIICLDSIGAVEWLTRELPGTSAVQIITGEISSGCEWPALKLTILGQTDLYGSRKQRRYSAKTASRGSRVERDEEITPGELVVHIDHGVGRFLGMREAQRDGEAETMTIEYDNGARLHVPTHHAHLLSRYIGVSGHQTKLHKLHGRRWQQEKIRAERSIVDFAATLLDVQARRSAKPGVAYDTNPPWFDLFEAGFPFAETPDQTKCISAVLEDLAAPQPMDRLICGDAGYGKTEVAMRAAFVVVMNGAQVAVLCPTTILAEQHYQTFRDRMASLPVRIEVLSRFRTRARRAKILADLAKGNVDILIGTHAILQPYVEFQELGLVVVDEEQRFGVGHKEHLKQIRATVDVLSLSATPIPRTLYMSMTGARDMSLLQTPPQERLAIETRVERDSDAVIHTAVRNELARSGQVYFLHNRVLTIELMLKRLQRILPGVRIGVAHGQMPAAQLNTTVDSFRRGEMDVLLCTTIIESGVDIPDANTIIIHRADRFGIADLYQLRGRVGRSSRRAYAYLLLPPQGALDEDARQRIGAIRRHGGLGGGLHLALRDLEIRGAGNMLGAEQSGHIAAVGFGLYCQLLRRTIARLKGEKPPQLIDVELKLDFINHAHDVTGENIAALPYSYVENDSQRISIHRQLAEASCTAEVRGMRAMLADRFGDPPPEVLRLLRLAELRITAANAGIVKVEARGGKLYLINRDQRPVLRNDGTLPRIKGRTTDQKLTAIFRLIPKPR